MHDNVYQELPKSWNLLLIDYSCHVYDCIRWDGERLYEQVARRGPELNLAAEVLFPKFVFDHVQWATWATGT
jgi:hypothetical protein